jgi:hypothetical protein
MGAHDALDLDARLGVRCAGTVLGTVLYLVNFEAWSLLPVLAELRGANCHGARGLRSRGGRAVLEAQENRPEPDMAIAIALIVLALGSVLFHFLSPWYFTPIASNWHAIDTTISITFWVTGSCSWRSACSWPGP